MSLPVKVFLHQADGNTEIHRLNIDQDVASSFDYLCKKLAHAFPQLKNGSFTVLWKDEEGDNIMLSCDDELVVALGCIRDGIFKIYVNQTAPRADFFSFMGQEHMPEPMENKGEMSGNTHPQVSCDGCNEGITGYRYKCLECPDYDLCTKCEQAGIHAHHYFLRISTPKDNPGFIPPFVGTLLRNYGNQQWGPRFHKHFMRGMHKAARAANHWSGGRHCNYGYPPQSSAYSTSGCARNANNQSCHQKKTSEPKPSTSKAQEQKPTGSSCDAGPSCGAQQPTNPLNFLAGLNPQMFQNIWTALGGLPTESGPSQEGAAQQGRDNTRRNSAGEEFLKNLGATVAAFLDPLGVDLEGGEDNTETKSRTNPQPSTEQKTDQKQQEKTEQMETEESSQNQTPTTTPSSTQAPTTTPLTQAPSSTPSTQAPPTTSSTQNLYPSDSLQAMLNALIHTQAPNEQTPPQNLKPADGAKGVSDNGGWAYVDRKEQGRSPMDTDELVVVDMPRPSVSVPTPITPATAPVVPNATSQHPPTEKDRRIADARSHLLEMGFKDEGGWLSYLLDVKNGDIHQVLDSLQHARHNH